MKINFAGKPIEILFSKESKKMNVKRLLRNPAEFYGDFNVDYLINFGDVFTPLIGRDDEKFGRWNPDKLAEQGIVVLEYFVKEAKPILNGINRLAKRIIDKPLLYDDVSLCREYFELVGKGYRLLRKHEKEFGFNNHRATPVSLERAGLVCTRLAKGIDKNGEVTNEVRVVTKRTHLKGEPEDRLAVTVLWRNKSDLFIKVKNKMVELNDLVNPASGASGAAFVIAASLTGAKPSIVVHRSINATRQGIFFIRKALEQSDIETLFYSLGECDELDKAYYLVGKNIDGEPRVVADAGHILRHFLPS